MRIKNKLQIKSRDDTIGEKEKRMYEVKKKNQELEKFKFVLDYKIKELKRQIEPRETEIAAMKEQIKVKARVCDTLVEFVELLQKWSTCAHAIERIAHIKHWVCGDTINWQYSIHCRVLCDVQGMDTELEQFHNSNAQLDGLIGELRTKVSIK
jgi:hypothetical protein